MNAISKEVGDRIRSFRLEQGLTQEKLAERAGMDNPSYLGQIERGQKNVTLVKLKQILSGLGLTFSEFFSDMEVSISPEDDVYHKCYQLLRQRSKKEALHIYAILLEIAAIQDN